jgi:glycosyltransferase involved in cell wall biosynthesis
MHGPRISIIVAIYRTEKYLSRCIMSILNQTYTNLEIILVDDGSPDHCPRICDDFAALDSRIKVIHKENEGLYSAWNAGIEQMTGEYVSFIDSDDFVSKDYVKSLLRMCKKHHCDISSCSLAYGSEHDFSHISRKGSIRVYDNIGAFMSRKIKAHVNARLYKTSLFTNESFRNVYCVDEDFTYRLFYKAKRVAFTDRKLYYYYQSPNSMTRNDKHYIPTDFIYVLESRIQYFADKEEELLELSWEYYCICLMLIYMKCKSDRLNRNDKGQIRSIYHTAYQRVMKNKITSPLHKLMLSAFFIAPDVCSMIVYGLHLRKRK